MSELVSIIMPAYNSSKYIHHAIESVVNQTYTNWELLIINDNSEDSTKQIIEKYEKEDNRIRVFNNNCNSGVVYSRNKALKNARGRYIAFLDSDDMWAKNKLEIQIKHMLINGVSFTFTSYSHIDENSHKTKLIPCREYVTYKDLLKSNYIGCLTVVIDRNVINILEMPNVKHEDYATWLHILKYEKKAYGIKEDLACYRKTNQSLTSNKFISILWTWKIYRQVEKLTILKSIYYLIYNSINGFRKHY